MTEKFAGQVASRVREVDELGVVLRQAEARLDARACGGRFGDGWRAEVAEQLTVVRVLAEEYRRAEAAAQTYAAAHRQIRGMEIVLKDSLEEAVRRLEAIRRMEHYNGGLHFHDETGQNAMLIRLADQVEEQIVQVCRELENQDERRREADQVYASTLDGLPSVAVAGFNHVQALLAARGVDSVSDLRDLGTDEAAGLIADAMGQVTDLGRPGDVEALALLLAVHGHDDAVMASALSVVGGAGFFATLASLGRHTHQSRALEVAHQMRGVLSRVSCYWDRYPGGAQIATDFATELLADRRAHDEVNVGALIVGFLLDDTREHVMGEHFTVAMTDGIDQLERTSTWWSKPSPMVHSGGPAPGHWVMLADGSWPDSPLRDPAGRAFEMLALYPNASADWLTAEVNDFDRSDLPLGEARRAYWYGKRDWSADYSGDGFAGPGALWAAAQRTDGSLLDPDHNDPAVQQRIAEMSTDVFKHLATNDTLIPENLTAAGVRHLGTAIAQQFPQLERYPISRLAYERADGTPLEASIAGHTANVPIVDVTSQDLTPVMGAVVAHHAGYKIVMDAVDLSSDSAKLMSMADQSALDKAISTNVRTQGIIEHVRLDAIVGQSERLDMERQRKNDMLFFTVDRLTPDDPITGYLTTEMKNILDRRLQTVPEIKEIESARADIKFAEMQDYLSSYYPADTELVGELMRDYSDRYIGFGGIK